MGGVEILALFLRDTRAGATALAAVFVTIMAVGGAALVTDHVWLVDQRDTLKHAANAASIAATHALRDELAADSDISDADLKAALKPVARSHIMMNLHHLPDKRYKRAKESLVIALDIDRNAFTVGVDAKADLGGLLMGKAFGFLAPDALKEMSVKAGVVASFSPLSVVLAIDVSQSMFLGLDGEYGMREDRRLNIVKQAANDLVAIATPDPDVPVSVGIVPWSARVCPSDFCESYHQTDTPPSTDRPVVEAAITALKAPGTATASFLGVERGRELLMAVKDVDTRALVLLTDGEDNFCGYETHADGKYYPKICSDKGAAQRVAACDAAKADGILIFVVAAMLHTLVGSDHESALRSCSSEGGGSGRFVFVNNATAEDLRAAFSDIAHQLKSMRRIY